MHPTLNIAVRAARAAGNVIARGLEYRDDLMLETKGDNDFVTRIDKEAERVIIDTISQSYPNHSFLGEESGQTKGENQDFLWIIDPLDGTTNFVRGIPHFCVSIALQVKGKLDQAVVFDPLRNELFTASKGSGAQLNGFRMRTSRATELANTVLATAFPFKDRDQFPLSQQRFAAIFEQCGDIRRSGSAALDLAYVAADRYDGYWEIGVQPWDTAAGELLVREAGGMVTDYSGGNDHVARKEVVAGNPKVVQAIVKAFR